MSTGTPPRSRPRRVTRPQTSRLGFLNSPVNRADGRNRMRAILLVALFVMSLYAARFADLQAVSSEKLAAKAEATRLVNVKLPAQRGTIYDRNGVPLAQTVPARDITVDQTIVTDPVRGTDPASDAAKLAPILGIDEQKIKEALTGTRRFNYVARQVSPDVWEQVRELNLPGILSERSSRRDYPAGSLAGNVLGFVEGFSGKGAEGLEAAFDRELAGTAGSMRYERSSTGGQIPTGTQQTVSPTAGDDIRMTIDRDLQWIAQQAIAAKVKEVDAESGTVVLAEVRTGRILALASVPNADPNDPGSSPDADRGNRATTEAFEPGSTSKVMTMSAVINEGKATTLTPFPNPDTLERGGTTFHDSESHPDQVLTLAGVLAQSSNVGTIQVAELIGPDKLYEYLKKFGIGEPSGLNFPGETTGYVPPVSDWSVTSFPTIAFGQGLSVSAVQAANVFATIANGGVKVTPTLIDAYIHPDGTVQAPPEPATTRVITEETSRTVLSMMEEVVGPDGTAPMAAIPGYRVAGKTGTAYKIDDSCGCYKGAYTASFIGVAPADNPELVAAVILQDPKKEHYGGLTGGPVFKEVMTAALQALRIAPSGAKAPKLPIYPPAKKKRN